MVITTLSKNINTNKFNMNNEEAKSFDKFLADKFIDNIKHSVLKGKFSPITAPWHYETIVFDYNTLKINPWEFTSKYIKYLYYDVNAQKVTFYKQYLDGWLIEDIFRGLEYGSTINNIYPRPLFRQTLNELLSNLDDYYEDWRESDVTRKF